MVMNTKNTILIGLGPHAKRIYLNLIKRNSINLVYIVELRSNEQTLEQYLKENNINVKVYYIDDKEKFYDKLSSKVQSDLSKILKNENIEYCIISTEPKAHFSYAKFMLKNNINILMDKPITSPIDVISTIKGCNKIKRDYDVLLSLYKKANCNFTIQCQRRFHPGYIYVKKLISKVIEEYNVPITYIDIYHSDGMWNMPNEFFSRENHPYKYGYGKLFHSGYHFVDILTWLLECNNIIDNKINNAKIYTSVFKPNDFFTTINEKTYLKLFNTKKFNDILKNKESVKNFGELDIHSMIDFKADNDIITHCTFNLLQSGFSRRAWLDLPKDTYKSNGRVRHERINIQLGPLLNVQIHSYQSDQRLKNKNKRYDVGEMDNFDIYIFRNVELIGGKSFEKISINKLIKNDDFLGNNEKAREICFKNFYDNKKGDSDFIKHQQSILLLKKICESIVKKSNIKFKWEWI